MDSFFFRVDHDLLRSDAFKSLGGSAIKVYLTIGSYADFGTGWAYPSIRTIARQAGLSRQTVLDAVDELTRAGLLAASKSQGRSSAYQILRQAPERPKGKAGQVVQKPARGVPDFLEGPLETGPFSLDLPPETGPKSYEALAQFFGPSGREGRPERDPHLTREESSTTSIPIPGTPFRLTGEGRLVVAVDLQELLTEQGIPPRLAVKLAKQKDAESVAKVLLNAFYLRSQGKLQNATGYIRAGIEDGYELLPEVEKKLKLRYRELEQQRQRDEERQTRIRRQAAEAAEEAAIEVFLNNMEPEELQRLIDQAVASLPKPMVRRNPTLSNPFIRSRVYELASDQ